MGDMILVYRTLVEANVTSLSDLAVYVSTEVPIFPILALISLFIIAALGSFFAQQRRSGIADIWASFSVASVFMTVVSMIMFLIRNKEGIPMVNLFTVLVCFGVTVLFAAILLTKDTAD